MPGLGGPGGMGGMGGMDPNMVRDPDVPWRASSFEPGRRLSLLSWNKSPSVVRWCWVWTLVHSDKGLFWQLKQQNLQSILQPFVPKNTSVFISPPPNFRVVRHGARTSHPVCDVVSVRASTVETLEIDGECEGEASCALNAM